MRSASPLPKVTFTLPQTNNPSLIGVPSALVTLESAFARGANLYRERLTFDEFEAGLSIMGSCAQALAVIADRSNDPARAQTPPPQPYRLAFAHGPILAKIDIERPLQAGPVDRQTTIEYVNRDDPSDRDHGVASITWFYATRQDGSDRRRVVTEFYDRFEGDITDRWVPVNAVRPEWSVQKETTGRPAHHILRGRTGGQP